MKRFAISLLIGFAIGALSVATGLAGHPGGGASSMAGSSMNGEARSGFSPTDGRQPDRKKPAGCLNAVRTCQQPDFMPCVPPQLSAVPVQSVIECPDLSPLPKDVGNPYDLYFPARPHLPELLPIPPG